MLPGFGKRQHILSKSSLGIESDHNRIGQVNGWACIHLQLRIDIGIKWGSSAVEGARHKIFLEYVDDRHTVP